VIDSERDEAVLETDIDPGGRGELVPRYCSLTAFARGVGSGAGVSIRSLRPGTALIVLTRNSRYRLIVLEGGGCVLVQGGARFPSPTPALLQGATAGGSFLKTGAIEVGLHLEFSVDRERIVTSTVRAVAIEQLPASEPARPQ
jgi:hypothetical protein